jgi:hypothetical protein
MKIAKILLAILVAISGIGIATPATAATTFTSSPVPVITGRLIPDAILSVDEGTWVPEPEEFTYTWKVGSTVVSNEDSFQVRSSDLNKSITVMVTGIKQGLVSKTKVSLASKISKPFQTVVNPRIPEEIYYGDIVVVDCGLEDCDPPCTRWGQEYWDDYEEDWVQDCVRWGATPTLKDSWHPDESLAKKPTVSMTYQWFKNGVPIRGATKNSYIVLATDAGSQLTVRVKGTASGYEVVQLESAASSPVVIRQFDSAPAPTLDEEYLSPKLGDLLEASIPESWEPEPDRMVYQWKRNGVAIKGATALTYRTVVADIGSKISFSLTGILYPYENKTMTTVETEAVRNGTLTAPNNSRISGILSVGQTVTAGVVGWGPKGVKLSYQWFRDGDLIPKATKVSYKIALADLDANISVNVTGQLLGYDTQVVEIFGEDLVRAATFKKIPKPTISGAVRIGSTLTAKPGAFSPAPDEFLYQWLRNGQEIEDATDATYFLTEDDAGFTISVRVQATSETLAPVTQVAVAGKWTVKTGTLTIWGSEIYEQCDSDEMGSCYEYTTDTDCYYDEYDEEVCEETPSGWYSFDAEDPDDIDEWEFSKTFSFDLPQTPITWKTTFTGVGKYGSYGSSANFIYQALDAVSDDYITDATTVFKPSKKYLVRTSAVSKLHEDKTVHFSMSAWSDGYFAFGKVIITYTYYY